MNLKTVGLATASIGAAAAFGLFKWKVMTSKVAWITIGVGVLLFVLSTPAVGETDQ